MLIKRKLAGGKVRVTFSAPSFKGVEEVFLVGDFNNWDETATPMTGMADGSFSIALTLVAGRKYAFRYWVPGQGWHNDWAADAYLPNEFGTDNSIVDLRTTGEKAVGKKQVAKKAAPARKSPAAKKPAKPPASKAKPATTKKKMAAKAKTTK